MSADFTCPINIGPRQRRARLFMGLVMLVMAVSGVAACIAGGLPRVSRLILFLPFFMGLLGLLQAKEKTCVVFAAQGIQNMDDGLREISDDQARAQLKLQARKVLIKAMAYALTLTVLCFLI